MKVVRVGTIGLRIESKNSLNTEFKHYNRCWLVHEAFSEALERLFIEQYMPTIPEKIKDFAQSLPQVTSHAILSQLLSDDIVKDYVNQYRTQRAKCLNGEFRKTTVLGNVQELIDRQQKLHYAINTNDFDLRILTLKESLPLCLATNRVHYALYGTLPRIH